MAEIASVVGMATTGFKLAKMLFSFAEAVGSMDKEIRRTAKDVSFFSDALSFLAPVLERGRMAGYITKDAFVKVQGVMDEFKSVVQELEAMIEKGTKSEEVIKMGKDETVPSTGINMSVPLARRLLYYFQQGNLKTIRAHLEGLKSTLHLMLSTLMSAERIEHIEKSDSYMRTDPETAKVLRAQDELRMECLVLTNEAAAAEVRKLDKPKAKITKFASKTVESVGDVRPSIASEGVFSQLAKTLPATNSAEPESRHVNNTALYPKSLPVAWVPQPSQTAQWGPIQPLAATGGRIPPPTAAAGLVPEESKIEVQESSQVAVALLALWASHSAHIAELPVDQKEPAATREPVDKGETAASKEPVDKVKTATSVDKTSTDGQWEADWESEEEELIDLFPRRESRPYGAMKERNNPGHQVKEEPYNMFPRRGPRPY